MTGDFGGSSSTSSGDVISIGGSFKSPSGLAGTFYVNGYYASMPISQTVNQGTPAYTYGTANVAYGAYAFIVASGPGSTDAGTVSLQVSGTSVTTAGARTAGDTETLVADITTMALNDYYQTTKRWIGQVTFTLIPAGGAATYTATFNVGVCTYEDNDEVDFSVDEFHCEGRAGANDTGFDVQVLHHQLTGWTYNALLFVPGTTPIASLAGDYVVEKNLANTVSFSWHRHGLSLSVAASSREGLLVRVVTGADNAVESMSTHFHGHH